MHRRMACLLFIALLIGLIPGAVAAEAIGWTPPPFARELPAPWRNASPGVPGADVGSVELRAVADTFVASSWGFKEYVFGSEESLWFGSDADLEHARTLLRFDLPAALPGAFAGASLFLPVAGGNAPLPLTATLHRPLWEWSESQVVWWNQPQTQYVTTFEVPADPAWVVVDVSSLYLGWRNGTYPNHGVEIRGPESPAHIAKGMFSREAGDDAPQATLVLFYTPDTLPPACSISGLSTPGTSPLHLSFYCSDTGGSAMAGVDVQVRDGQGPWQDAGRTVGDGSTFTANGLTGGHTYAFRVRGEDNAHNFSPWTDDAAAVTTIENVPPEFLSSPLPAWLRTSEVMSQVAEASRFSDPYPASEPLRVERRYMDEADGVWRTIENWEALIWLPGHRYRFRTRATDSASNATPWYTLGPVTIYDRKVQGRVLGPDGRPLPGIPLSSAPPALNVVVTGQDGGYTAYYRGAAAAALASAAPNFKLAGQADFPGPGDVEGAQFYLYPLANSVRNGDFSAPVEDGWQVSGAPAVRSARSPGDSDLALRMGALPSQTFTAYDAAKQPCMAAGPDGTTHLAWVDYRSEWYAPGQLYYATLASGGAAWSAPVLLGETAYWAYTYGALACRMAVDAGGRVYLLSSALSGPALYDLRTRASGGAWEQAPAPANNMIYSIAAREPGVLHVVYSDECRSPDCAALGDPNIYYKTWRVAQGWSAPRPVGRIVTYSDTNYGVQLLLTADGARHVIWEWQPDRYQGGLTTIRYTTSSDGLAWSWPQDMGPGSRDLIEATLRADNAGQLVAFWYTFNSEANQWQPMYSRRIGGAWSAPRPLGLPAPFAVAPAAPGDAQGHSFDVTMTPGGQWWYLSQMSMRLTLYTGASLDALAERTRFEDSREYAVLAAAPHAMLVLDQPQNQTSRRAFMRLTQLPYNPTAPSSRIAQTVQVPSGPFTPYLYYTALVGRNDGGQVDAQLKVFIQSEEVSAVAPVYPPGMAAHALSLEKWRGQQVMLSFEFDPLGSAEALAWLDNIYVTHQPLNVGLSISTTTVRPLSNGDIRVHIELDNRTDAVFDAPLELTWPAAWSLKDSTLAPSATAPGRASFPVKPDGVSTHAFDVTLGIPSTAAPGVATVQLRLDDPAATYDFTPQDNTAVLRLIVDGQAVRLPSLYR